MSKKLSTPDTETDKKIRGYIDARKSFIMVSGAGSGKTTSLVKALDHIRKTQADLLGSNIQKVACITYTDIAAGEIFKEVGEDPLFQVSTIHSFLWTVIKPFQHDIKSWVERRIAERITELKATRDAFGPRVRPKTRDDNAQSILEYEERQRLIGSVKLFKYESGSNYTKGVLGHDDIVRMVPTLIAEKPLLREIIASTHPFIFVDESQDTLKEVVDALKLVEQQARGQFCLGFFGDPMQKIFVSGIGAIDPAEGWEIAKKPENFRCPEKVLSVINKIRETGDGLVQVGVPRTTGADSGGPGTARLFVIPDSADRSASLDSVRRFIAKENGDPLWLSNESSGDVRVLVLEHSAAAKRLDFDQLHQAFSRSAPESMKMGFREGTLWAITPFSSAILPVVDGAFRNDRFGVISCLRRVCPLLDQSALQKVSEPDKTLSAIKDAVQKLTELMGDGSTATVGDVLRLVRDTQLATLDERLTTRLDGAAIQSEDEEFENAIAAYLASPAVEVKNYVGYIERRSPYATHQGIKGAEFKRVLVVLDDSESRHRQFSYDKYIGTAAPSDTDRENIAQGNESVFDRTRRLFYVCCSRALQDLAVVWFVPEPDKAVDKFNESGIFERGSTFTMSQIESR